MNLRYALVFLLAPFAQAQTSQPTARPDVCTADQSAALPSDIAIARMDFGSAVRGSEKASQQDPSSIALQAAHIRAVLSSDKAREGLASARALSKASPADPYALTALGEALYRIGAFSDSLRVLVRSVAANKCYGHTFYVIAKDEMAMGNRGDAARHTTLAHRLSPNDPAATLAFLNLNPETDNYSALTSYIENSHNFSNEDQLDTVGVVTRRKAFANSHCTVSSPDTGSTMHLHYAVDSGTLGIEATFAKSKRELDISEDSDGIRISRGLVTSMGLQIETRFTSSFLFSGGRGNYAVARIPSIRFGDVEFKNCEAVVSEDAQSFEYSQGSVGINFFRDFIVRIDPGDEIFSLTPLPPLGHAEPGDHRWSNVAASHGSDVPSMNGGIWDFQNKAALPDMKGWQPYFALENNILIPAKVGPSDPKPFFISTFSHELYVADADYSDVAPLSKSLPPGSPGLSKEALAAMGGEGYFLSVGGVIMPVGHWDAGDLTRYNRQVGLSLAGVIPLSIIAQLDISYDQRDQLFKVDHPKKKMHSLLR